MTDEDLLWFFNGGEWYLLIRPIRNQPAIDVPTPT